MLKIHHQQLNQELVTTVNLYLQETIVKYYKRPNQGQAQVEKIDSTNLK